MFLTRVCQSVHRGRGIYDVTSCLDAWSHVPSMEKGLCLWFHVPSGAVSVSGPMLLLGVSVSAPMLFLGVSVSGAMLLLGFP